MTNQSTFTLVNLQNGNLAFKIYSFDDDSHFDHIQRLNYYSLIWVQSGEGRLKADMAEYDFKGSTLFAFVPYQPFMLMTSKAIQGIVLNFHPDFFCIHKPPKAMACNGVLFNNIYQPPFIPVDENAANSFSPILAQMKAEIQNAAPAQYELLVSYLQIFLINASRIKLELEPPALPDVPEPKQPFILQNLKDAIERDFKTKHSASEYADTLNISPKALGKITKTHFNKTLTDLIAERIIIEAKRELYLTNKSVKEIAYELGYEDEHYFSRFFKINADVSPQMYRETVGFGRG